jgi:hypothetical protein
MIDGYKKQLQILKKEVLKVFAQEINLVGLPVLQEAKDII